MCACFYDGVADACSLLSTVPLGAGRVGEHADGTRGVHLQARQQLGALASPEQLDHYHPPSGPHSTQEPPAPRPDQQLHRGAEHRRPQARGEESGDPLAGRKSVELRLRSERAVVVAAGPPLLYSRTRGRQVRTAKGEAVILLWRRMHIQ